MGIMENHVETSGYCGNIGVILVWRFEVWGGGPTTLCYDCGLSCWPYASTLHMGFTSIMPQSWSIKWKGRLNMTLDVDEGLYGSMQVSGI